MHRHRHTQRINKKNAEMDSRPRELANEERFAGDLEELPIINDGGIPEGVNHVGS